MSAETAVEVTFEVQFQSHADGPWYTYRTTDPLQTAEEAQSLREHLVTQEEKYPSMREFAHRTVKITTTTTRLEELA
jgi:hypothetical protein